MSFRSWFLPVTLLLLVMLCACSSKPKEEAFSTSDVETLLNADVFTGEMASIDPSLLASRFSLDSTTLKEGACSVSTSSSLSRDEVAVFVFSDEEAAKAAVDALKEHISAQIQDATSYCPDAVPHLEAAILKQAGNTLLMAVGDPDKLPDAVEKLH